MAGNADALSFNIIAVNSASPELAKLQKDLQDTAKAVQQHAQVVSTSSAAGASGLKTLAESYRPVLAATREVATGIAGTLNPALGNMVGSLGLVARGAGAMGLALGGVTAGVVAAGVAFKNYLEVSSQVAETQAKLNLLARSFDLGGAKSMVAGFALELETLDQRATGLTGRWVTGWRKITDALGQTVDATKALAAAQAAVEAVVPFERALGLAQQRALQIEATRAHTGVFLGKAEVQADLGDYGSIAAVMRQQLLDQGAQILETIRRESEREFAAALATRQPASELSRITELGMAKHRTFGAQRAGALAAFDESVRRGRLGIIGVTEAVSAEPRALDEEAEGFRIGQTAIRDIRRESTAQTNELLSAQISLRQQAVGLTSAQRLELTLTAIQEGRTLAYAQAEGKENQEHLKAMADLNAEMKTTIERQKEAAQTNPFVGLTLGLQEVVDEFTSAGELMRQGVHQLGGDMARTFSSTFTQVVMGDFKKLSELPKLFAMNFVTAFSDAVAKAAIGNLFSTFSRALGGNAGFFSMLGGGGGSGGSGGGGLVQVGGQVFQQVAAGGGQTVLVPLSGTAGTMGSGAGFNLSSLPTPPLSLFSGGGGSWSNLMRTPLSVLFGGSLFASAYTGGTAAGASALGADVIALGGGADLSALSGSGAGLTLGTTLGGITALAGLGFTIYSGLRGAPTWQNIAISHVSGMLSGAMAGFYIDAATGFSDWGAGTLIGAIAGGLLGAGAGSLGKGALAKKLTPSERSYQAGQAGRSALSAAIAGAKSLEEMQAILNGKWSPYNEVAIVAYSHPGHNQASGAGVYLAYPMAGHMPFPDVLTMLADPRYIDNLEINVAGPAGGGSASYDATLTTQAQDKWHTLAAGLAEAFVGFRENFGPGFQPLGPALLGTSGVGVERFTALSGLDALSRAQGQDIDLSLDTLKRQGLSDDQIEQLLRLMQQVDRDRSLNFFIRPEEFSFG